jgi:hypothetical protein
MIKQTCFERLKLKMNTYQIGNNTSKSNVSKIHQDYDVQNFLDFHPSLFFESFNVFRGLNGHIHHIMYVMKGYSLDFNIFDLLHCM